MMATNTHLITTLRSRGRILIPSIPLSPIHLLGTCNHPVSVSIIMPVRSIPTLLGQQFLNHSSIESSFLSVLLDVCLRCRYRLLSETQSLVPVLLLRRQMPPIDLAFAVVGQRQCCDAKDGGVDDCGEEAVTEP
jgi:hypothetical protein